MPFEVVRNINFFQCDSEREGVINEAETEKSKLYKI